MKIKVAATQMSCDWEIENNLKKFINLIEKAAEKGANIILLQELFQTPYFCIQYDEEIFKLEQTFENNSLINEMSEVAKKHKVVLPISFFEKDNNAYFNSIAVIDADGKVLENIENHTYLMVLAILKNIILTQVIQVLKFGKQLLAKLVLVFAGINGFLKLQELWL